MSIYLLSIETLLLTLVTLEKVPFERCALISALQTTLWSDVKSWETQRERSKNIFKFLHCFNPWTQYERVSVTLLKNSSDSMTGGQRLKRKRTKGHNSFFRSSTIIIIIMFTRKVIGSGSKLPTLSRVDVQLLQTASQILRNTSRLQTKRRPK